MTIVLHRFPLSHFSEKGRALLEFKKLDYRIVEHRLGLPQLAVFRLSGQRKVPVIEHDGQVVSDSTKIALYLEEKHPEPALLPADEATRRDVLVLEERIDRVLGGYAPVVWIDWLVRERPEDLARVLEIEVWGAGRGHVIARALRASWGARRVGAIVEKSQDRTRTLLHDLCDRLSRADHLCGKDPTLADVAAAGLALHLEFPQAKRMGTPEFAGVGVPGFADAPEFRRFFEWRRGFYQQFLHSA